MQPPDLTAIEELLGRQTVAKMAEIFVAEWAKQAKLLGAELYPAGDARAAQHKAAHDLVTNAGSLGFNELSTAARRLEQAIVNGDSLLSGASAPLVLALGADAQRQLSLRYGPF